MKVVWLCSRLQAKTFSHLLISDEYYENNKSDIEKEIAYSLKKEEYEAAKQVKNCCIKDKFEFEGSFEMKPIYECVKELCRVSDNEEIDLLTEREFPETFDEEEPVSKDNSDRLSEYDIYVEKIMFMPVMVTVPDDSTDEEIKQALMEKMNRIDKDNKYGIYPIPVEYSEVEGPFDFIDDPDEPAIIVSKWGRKEDVLEYDEKSCDICELEWYKYYKRPILGKFYDTKYQVDWEYSHCRLSYDLIEEENEEREVEKIIRADKKPDPYFSFDGGDVDGSGFWDEDFEFHENDDMF